MCDHVSLYQPMISPHPPIDQSSAKISRQKDAFVAFHWVQHFYLIHSFVSHWSGEGWRKKNTQDCRWEVPWIKFDLGILATQRKGKRSRIRKTKKITQKKLKKRREKKKKQTNKGMRCRWSEAKKKKKKKNTGEGNQWKNRETGKVWIRWESLGTGLG